MRRVSFLGFACGMRASGKSTLLARYAALFPRRFVYDPNAEFIGVYRGAIEALTLAETAAALKQVARRDRWTIVSAIPPEDFVRLCGYLAPAGNPRGGYSLNVDGLLIECGEVDTIAPNNAAIAPEIRNLFQRGRHYRISVACATQRPRDVHRIVTSQADVLAFFRQHEARDLEYLASLTSDAMAALIERLPKFAHLRYMPRTMSAAIVDASGKETRINPHTGEIIR